MGTAFFRFYGFTQTDFQKSELIGTAHYYLIISSFIVCGFLYAFSKPFSNLLFETKLNASYIKIIVFTGLFQIISLIPFRLYRAKLQPLKYVTVSLIGLLIQVAFNIYFIIVVKLGVKGVLIGNAISAISVGIINVIVNKDVLILKFSSSKLKDLLNFGFPLIFVSIFFWILQFSDRFLLQKLTSTSEVGLYSLGNRFATILHFLVITPFSIAWGGYCYKIANKENAREIFKQITTYLLFGLCSIGLGLVIFTPLVIKFMASELFLPANKVVLPLVCANITYGMFSIFDLGVNIAKKTHYFVYIMCFGAILNIALNMFIIPKYGMMGASFVSLISYLVIMFITYYISQKLYYIPFEKDRFLKLCFVFLIIAGCSWICQTSNIIFDIIFRIILMTSFFVGLYLLKFFQKKEIDIIKRLYSRLKERKGIFDKIKFGFELISRQ